MKKIGNKAALTALMELLTPAPLHPNEFTVHDYVEKWRQAGTILPKKTAGEHLKKLVDKGKLSVRKTTVNGHLANVYLIP